LNYGAFGCAKIVNFALTK